MGRGGVDSLDSVLPLWCPQGKGAAGESVRFPPILYLASGLISVVMGNHICHTHKHTHMHTDTHAHTYTHTHTCTHNAAAAQLRATTCSSRGGNCDGLARPIDLWWQAGMTGSYSNSRPATASSRDTTPLVTNTGWSSLAGISTTSATLNDLKLDLYHSQIQKLE